MENANNSFKRNSSIDLLRIIAIFLICFSHAAQTLREVIDCSTNSILNISSGILYTFGNVGVVLFVICSSYYLADKDSIKFRKIFNILLDSTVISVFILILFLISKTHIETDVIIKQIFPDVFALVWFIPCYLIFYIFSPVLSIGLKTIGRKYHFILMLILLVIYGFLGVLGIPPIGSRLFQFVYIFIITSYVKWYSPNILLSKKKCLLIFFVLFVLNYILHMFMYFLKSKITILVNVDFFSFYSPILIFSLIGLFFFFVNNKIESKIISYLSSLTLFVYVIHENYLLRTITRVWYYNHYVQEFGLNNAVWLMFFLGFIMFILGFIIAIIYDKTIHRFTEKVSNCIQKGIDRHFDEIDSK